MPSVRAARSGWIAPCAAWVLSAALLAVALLFDRRLTQVGRGDLRTFAPETWVLVAGMVSALVVGTVLAARRPEHPAGWLFLGLGLSMAVAGPIDGYATYGVLARAGSLPGAAGAAHLGDVTLRPVARADRGHLAPDADRSSAHAGVGSSHVDDRRGGCAGRRDRSVRGPGSGSTLRRCRQPVGDPRAVFGLRLHRVPVHVRRWHRADRCRARRWWSATGEHSVWNAPS